MKPFEAIKEAISEVFGPETQEWEKRDILVGSEEWLRDDDEREHVIASVYSEYGLAPEEPYSMRGPSTHDKWEKVSEIASKKVGREIYWESCNPGKFQFQWVEVLNHDET